MDASFASHDAGVLRSFLPAPRGLPGLRTQSLPWTFFVLVHRPIREQLMSP
jgi:hypothetical protein